MPMTVITLTKVPPSLRGDLTKWMQEISTGVYVGNFNSKVRSNLWERITQNVGKGQATISYASRNELGYNFETCHTYREIVNYEGIPLVKIPNNDKNSLDLKSGFSKASKISKIKKINKSKMKNNNIPEYIFIDLETDGLNFKDNNIIEIGALKVSKNGEEYFDHLIKNDSLLPFKIKKLTGINDKILNEHGEDLFLMLKAFKAFISNKVLTGYNINFDIDFLNYNLKKFGLEPLNNNIVDIIPLVKKEKMFLNNYKLETVLHDYEIFDEVPHRALLDCKLIKVLSTKVNGFSRKIKKKS